MEEPYRSSGCTGRSHVVEVVTCLGIQSGAQQTVQAHDVRYAGKDLRANGRAQ